MDQLGLITLRAEVDADLLVLRDVASLTRARLELGGEPELEACAFQLIRFYNVIEQAGLRIAKAFENHIDNESGWHTELIKRLSLEIPSVRPFFFSASMLHELRELRGFRHIAVHAYDLQLVKERLAALVTAAEKIASSMQQVSDNFFEKVRVLIEC